MSSQQTTVTTVANVVDIRELKRGEYALRYARVLAWAVFPIWWIDENGHCACPEGKHCGDPTHGECAGLCKTTWTIDPNDATTQACPSCGGKPKRREGVPGKHPIGACAPRGFLSATKDEALIRDWWAKYPKANIGVATGKVSGFWALDVDERNGGFEQLAALVAKHGPLPTTTQACTGSGSAHYLFNSPDEIEKFARKIEGHSGIDVKGDGGYILVAPSNHKSGRCYEWEAGLDPFEFEPTGAPDWLRCLVARKQSFAIDYDVNPDCPVDRSILGRLFRAMGWLGDRALDCGRARTVRCPNWHEHTNKTNFGTDTVLYPPCKGSEYGYVLCKHDGNPHCERLGKTEEVLRYFPAELVETVRREAAAERRARERERGVESAAAAPDGTFDCAPDELAAAAVEAAQKAADLVPDPEVVEAERRAFDEALRTIKAEVDVQEVVASVVASVGSVGTAAAGGNRYEWTDANGRAHPMPFKRGDQVEIVERLVGAFTEVDVKPVVVLGQMWRYNATSGLWTEVTEREQQDVLKRLNNVEITGKDKPLEIKNSLIKDVFAIAQRDLRDDNFFSGAPVGALFSDGFVTVDGNGESATIVRLPHGPEHRALFCLPHPFAPGAEPKVFLQFLSGALRGDEVVDESIQCIRELLGACFLGCAARFKRALLLTGESNSGKSVLLDIARGIFPASAIASVSPEDFSNPNERYKLVNTRLNICAEVPTKYLGNVSHVKSVIAGDAISVKKLFKDTGTAVLTAGHIFACNGLPETGEFSAAIENRFLLVPFDNVIKREEQDPFLRENILRDEAGLIASWALEGALHLMRRKRYDVPEAMQERLGEWRESGDPVAQFAKEHLTRSVDSQARSSDLYAHFREWAEGRGFDRLPHVTRFGMRLKQIFGKDVIRKIDGLYRYRLCYQNSRPLPGSEF